MRRRMGMVTAVTGGNAFRPEVRPFEEIFQGHKCDSEGGAVSTHITAANATEVLLAKNVPQWFAIQTRSRHEKKAADELRGRGIEVFLPLITQTRKWSDRAKKVDFPLFAGYAFVHIAPEPKTRVNVLSAHGVVRFVGPSALGTPIPASEIETLRTALENDIALRPLPFIKVGQR